MDKIVYALNLIVDFIDMSDVVDENAISGYLFFSGFGDYEVRQVLAVLDIDSGATENYFRVFSKTEKSKFSPDAINYLNKLILSGVIDFLATEDIIDNAQELEAYKVSVDRVKELTLFHLLEKKLGVAGGKKRPEEYIQ